MSQVVFPADLALPSRGPPVAEAYGTGERPNPGVKNEDEEEDEGDLDDYGTSAFTSGVESTAEKMRLRMLLDSFDEQQMQRYEIFRRANLQKSNVKKLANQILAQSVTPNVGIVIAGFGKVFVGEIVERAREVQKRWGDVGSLSPDHLREAYRSYKAETGLVPSSNKPKSIFR